MSQPEERGGLGGGIKIIVVKGTVYCIWGTIYGNVYLRLTVLGDRPKQVFFLAAHGLGGPFTAACFAVQGPGVPILRPDIVRKSDVTDLVALISGPTGNALRLRGVYKGYDLEKHLFMDDFTVSNYVK